MAWAGNFLTSKLALLEFPPLLFTGLRLCLLALLLAPLLKRPPSDQWPRLIAVALCNGVLHFGTSFWALSLSKTIASPAIVMQSYVPMATLLAWWLLGERFQWRASFTPSESTNLLRYLAVSLWHPDPAPIGTNVTLIRNLNLGVPRLSQGDYKGGEKTWCSPTSLTMILSYWAEQEHRSDWQFRVPKVAAAVFDPAWPGTGNWPFNMAFAGSLPGLRASVVRFNSLEDLHPWLAAGVPIGLSLSYNRLLGRDFGGSGHLVVCVGLEGGDYLLNDPGSKAQSRRRVDAKTLDLAWRESDRVAYLVFPQNHHVPPWPGARSTQPEQSKAAMVR